MEANKTYEMACTIPFGKLREIRAPICGDKIIPLFLVYLADLDALCSGRSLTTFMHKNATRRVCVNGKQPR